MQSDSLSSAAVVELLLERDQELRSEAKAEKAELEAKMQVEKAELRKEMAAEKAELREEFEAKLENLTPKEAISAERLTALEARLEALHAAQLLTDEELFSLEDCLADYIEVKASCGVLTTETMQTNAAAAKLLKLIVLSEGLGKDAAFARQARRKFM